MHLFYMDVQLHIRHVVSFPRISYPFHPTSPGELSHCWPRPRLSEITPLELLRLAQVDAGPSQLGPVEKPWVFLVRKRGFPTIGKPPKMDG